GARRPPPARAAFLAEWTSARRVTQRVANLRDTYPEGERPGGDGVRRRRGERAERRVGDGLVLRPPVRRRGAGHPQRPGGQRDHRGAGRPGAVAKGERWRARTSGGGEGGRGASSQVEPRSRLRFRSPGRWVRCVRPWEVAGDESLRVARGRFLWILRVGKPRVIAQEALRNYLTAELLIR